MTFFTSQVVILCAFTIIGLQIHEVFAWSFAPVPEPVVNLPGTNDDPIVSIICQADTPLTRCQYSVFAVGHSYPLVDLSRGSNSSDVTMRHAVGDWDVYDVSYNGTGLEQGQCGATFTNLYFVSFIVGCRGANHAGEWKQMHFSVILPRNIALPASVSPPQSVVLPGRTVSVLVKAAVPLRFCSAILPHKPRDTIVFEGDASVPQTQHNTYSFHGTNLSRGECGITLSNITRIYNGPIFILGLTKNFEAIQQISSVIVADPPTETFFNVDKLNYSVGDTLTATCSSLLSRPVANLTWTLDDRIIRQDGIDDEFQEDVWSWPWDKKNITQKLTLILEETHFGKKLECKVQHLAMTGTRSMNAIISQQVL